MAEIYMIGDYQIDSICVPEDILAAREALYLEFGDWVCSEPTHRFCVKDEEGNECVSFDAEDYAVWLQKRFPERREEIVFTQDVKMKRKEALQYPHLFV